MKPFLTFIIMGMAVFACAQKKSGFEINVNLEGADGQILLEQRNGQGFVPVDTANIKNGTAIFTGNVEYPAMYYLSVLGQRPKAIVFIENSKMTITGIADSLNQIKVSGSATHDDFDLVFSQIRKVQNEYMKLYSEAKTAGASGDTAKSNRLIRQIEELYNSIGIIQEDFIKEHPSSFVVPYFLPDIRDEQNLEKLDGLLNVLDPKLDVVPTIASLKERVGALKKVAIGQIAPDFTMNDQEGKPVKFSDIYSKNKVTMLDFWAGWCGPCRRESPNIVAVYNDYKDKGFTVFGVSLDRTKESWLKAIADDGLTWTHVSDLAYWNSAVAKTYQIHSIPANLLVDKNGKIIAKNQLGEDLRKTVSKILD